MTPASHLPARAGGWQLISAAGADRGRLTMPDTEQQQQIFKPGDLVNWSHTPRGGYGYSRWVPAVVVKIYKVQVSIDAELEGGGTKRVSVNPASLRPREPEPESPDSQLQEAVRVIAADHKRKGTPGLGVSWLQSSHDRQVHAFLPCPKTTGAIYKRRSDDLASTKFVKCDTCWPALEGI